MADVEIHPIIDVCEPWINELYGEPCYVIELGDETWHGGPGWYYYDAEYSDEGSCGPYDTREECEQEAQESYS